MNLLDIPDYYNFFTFILPRQINDDNIFCPGTDDNMLNYSCF